MANKRTKTFPQALANMETKTISQTMANKRTKTFPQAMANLEA
jgi:hypothetical protein